MTKKASYIILEFRGNCMQRKDYFIGFIIAIISLACYFVLMVAIGAQSILEFDSSSGKILALVFSMLGIIFIIATIVLNALAIKVWKEEDEIFLKKKKIIISAITCNFIMNIILIIVFALNNMPSSFTFGISIAFHLFVFIGIVIANSLILKEVVPLFQKEDKKS